MTSNQKDNNHINGVNWISWNGRHSSCEMVASETKKETATLTAVAAKTHFKNVCIIQMERTVGLSKTRTK